MTPKQAYDIIFKVMKPYYDDNKELHSIISPHSKQIAHLINSLFAHEGYLKQSEIKANPEEINRENILNRLKRKLVACSNDKEFLELTKELNKMEDNYKTTEKDTQITLNIIDYSNVSEDYIKSLMP